MRCAFVLLFLDIDALLQEVESDKAGSESDTQGRSGSKVGIQERLKRFRTPHATRNDKRRSIDG